ncbi:uncharacterized protein LOC6567908 [Drosophila grimshawi]|uniref:GH21163 n=1 Tax=Drosophila grimshawi TaxID=7222 RepID=B4JRP5_DROGR|nr:uncharacterized protein LOC6567908 [Drosophila grimshawi]EDV94435.1 GH21163 [Drosophila grimshawi]
MSQAHSSDDEADFKAVNTANQQRIKEKVAKINYVDGVVDGREKVFQSSFDQGYADGLRTGIEIAKFRAFYDALSDTDVDDNLAREQLVYQDMKMADATDKTHFKYLEYQTEPLRIVSEKQKLYIDETMKNLAGALPTTTNLFRSKAK